jgi:hypothetical protein
VKVEITTKSGNKKQLDLTHEQWVELYRSATWEGLPLADVLVLRLDGSEKAPNRIIFP